LSLDEVYAAVGLLRIICSPAQWNALIVKQRWLNLKPKKDTPKKQHSIKTTSKTKGWGSHAKNAKQQREGRALNMQQNRAKSFNQCW